VFLILVGALMENLAREVNVTGMHGRSNSALRAAYEGVEAMQYAFELNDAGLNPGVPPGPVSQTFTDQDGMSVTYTATVDAFRWTAPLPYYVIHSQGQSGTSTRNVDALIQKVPFSAIQLFTISETNNFGGAVVYTNGEVFDGPVYSGGPMIISYQDGGSTIFTNTVTTVNTPKWIPHTPLSCCTAGTDWNAVISNKGDFVQVSQPMTLPTVVDNNAVEYAAFAGNPSPSTLPTLPVVGGIYINGANVTGGGGGPITTGIYIDGAATLTSVGSKALGTNIFTFLIGGVTTHVIVDFNAMTTTVTNASNNPIASYSGVPNGEQPPGVTGANGAIFASDGLTLNPGNTFRGSYTLAVPDAKGLPNPNMIVLGSQQYADLSQTTTDELAFWSNDIVLTDGASGPIEIDGLLLTGYYGECSAICNDGTFYNSACGPVTCGGGTGVLTLRGSLIENVRGKRGTLGSSITGFSTNGVYDSRLATKPPPYTPTTTAYNILALCAEDSGTTCGQ